MTAQKQFKYTKQRDKHYDRKVRKVGNTLYVALGKVLPASWQYVRITPTNRTDRAIVITIEKLYGENNIAQIKRANKNGEQNT